MQTYQPRNRGVLRRATNNFQIPQSSQLVSKTAVRQIVKSMISSEQETKYYGSSSNGTIDFSGSIYPIFRPPQGDTDSTRDGDMVTLSIGELNYAMGAADTTNLVRVIIFKWRDNTTPAVSDILQTSYLGTVTAPLAPINWDNRVKIKVYHDSLYPLVLSSSAALNSAQVKYKPKGQAQFVAGGTTTSTNQIYLLAISDSGAAPNPAFEFGSLIGFTDS